MALERQDSIEADAIQWHIRLRDGGDAVWEAFAEWLAEDPRHPHAYDTVEQADLAIEPLLDHVIFREAANDSDGEPEAPARMTRRWAVLGGALAASLAAALVLVPQLTSSRYEIATPPGGRQVVTLDPTTQVVLNGSTRMTFDHDDPRFAALAQGEALFRVRHDPAKPFTLELGQNQVVDLGTVFNVVREGQHLRVAVAEGKVVYNPHRDAISLDAGQTLVAEEGSSTVQVAPIATGAVGSWEKGRLVYTQAPMSRVAADLARTLGVRIIVAPSLADRPFSGSITLDGKGPEQFRRLELALNVAMESGTDGWTMRRADGARR